MRANARRPDELRPVRITRGFTKHAEASVLGEFGDTRELCTASAEEPVPPFLKDTRNGWVTAEWGETDLKRRARFYRITAAGRKRLAAESAGFDRLVNAITTIMQAG